MMNKLRKIPGLRSIKQYRHFNKATAGVGILLFATAGTILLFRSHAATPFASAEPEQGTKTAAATVGFDGTASGGQYVKFGGSSTQPANLFVAVGGAGANCTQTAPCGDVNTAYQKANPGDVIEVAGGSYPKQTINYRPAAESWSQNVIVRPASASSVTVAGFIENSPRLTVLNLTISGFSQFRSTDTSNANYGRFENVDSTSEIYLGSNHVAVINSRIKPSYFNANPITISGTETNDPAKKAAADDVLIQNNEIGPAYASLADKNAGIDIHNESVQIYQGTNIVLRNNVIWAGGTTGTLAVGEHYGLPTRNVLMENNFIEQCGRVKTVPADAYCQAFYAVTASAGSATTPTLTFRSNTVRGAFSMSNAIISGNVIDSGYYAACDTSWNYNLINVNQDSSGCDGTNTRAIPQFASGGFRLAPGSPGIDLGVPAGSAALDDIDRVLRNCGPIDAGADENCGSALGLPPN